MPEVRRDKFREYHSQLSTESHARIPHASGDTEPPHSGRGPASLPHLSQVTGKITVSVHRREQRDTLHTPVTHTKKWIMVSAITHLTHVTGHRSPPTGSVIGPAPGVFFRAHGGIYLQYEDPPFTAVHNSTRAPHGRMCINPGPHCACSSQCRPKPTGHRPLVPTSRDPPRPHHDESWP